MLFTLTSRLHCNQRSLEYTFQTGISQISSKNYIFKSHVKTTFAQPSPSGFVLLGYNFNTIDLWFIWNCVNTRVKHPCCYNVVTRNLKNKTNWTAIHVIRCSTLRSSNFVFFFSLVAGSIIWQTSSINLDVKPCAFERLTNSDHVLTFNFRFVTRK